MKTPFKLDNSGNIVISSKSNAYYIVDNDGNIVISSKSNSYFTVDNSGNLKRK